MQKWQAWLNSLNTPGGNLLLLCMYVLTIIPLTLWVVSREPAGPMHDLMVATFGGATGAFLKTLSGRTSDVPALPGVTSSTTTASHTSEAPKEKEVPKP